MKTKELEEKIIENIADDKYKATNNTHLPVILAAKMIATAINNLALTSLIED